jgi:hypothetical protein
MAFSIVIHFSCSYFEGSNRESGPDSNGSGKSSLAMATLWALTGTLDARRSMDMKVADVVNDDSKVRHRKLESTVLVSLLTRSSLLLCHHADSSRDC